MGAAVRGASDMGADLEGSATQADATPSLYERLGGVYAIAVVVDDFIDRIWAIRG
jgi:hypothetical protein